MNATQRKDSVLGSVIELYVRTGEPVGSKVVSAYLNDVCSTATIRNDMGELIERGYLLQPHTSAGRVPSAKGYRYYVDRLMTTQPLSAAEKSAVRSRLPSFAGDPDRFMTDTAKALADLTRWTTMITSPVDTSATLKRMEIIPMSARSVLVAVLTSSGVMKSKVCHLPGPVSAQELAQFSRLLNERFCDLPLAHVTPAAAQTLAVSFGAQALRFAPLLDLAFDAVRDSFRCALLLEGQANLLLYKEFSPAAVIDLYTRRDSLAPFLQTPDETSVFIGPELQDLALRNACLITSEYRLSDGLKGKIGLLGPIHTDYAHMVPLVEFAARAVQNKVEHVIQ